MAGARASGVDGLAPYVRNFYIYISSTESETIGLMHAPEACMTNPYTYHLHTYTHL